MTVRATIIVLVMLVPLAGCASPPADAQSDVQLHLLEALDDSWTPDPGTNARPATGPVRFVLPYGWGYIMQQCMIESGFPDYSYSLKAGFKPEQRAASYAGDEGLAWYLCTKSFPAFDVSFSRPNDERISALYSYYSHWLLPCLASHGIPVRHVPDAEQFAKGEGGQRGSWNPYLDSVPPTSISAVDMLIAQCPPYPPQQLP